MTPQAFGETYGGTAPENYQRYFVPAIGAPVAEDLIQAAALAPGERVLDVACGTGVVTRLAAERVGATGTVAGLDVNPGMLQVARKVTDDATSIDWYETSAEAMPLPDESFDVVLCQMGLQFIPDKLAALREMRRVLAADGRVVLNLPGPTPPLFAAMADALAHNIRPQSAAFAHAVFSLSDPDEIRELAQGAGLREVVIQNKTKTLPLPAPADFLWQYVHSTPLVNVVQEASPEQRAALERDVCSKWAAFVSDGVLMLEVPMTTLIARK